MWNIFDCSLHTKILHLGTSACKKKTVIKKRSKFMNLFYNQCFLGEYDHVLYPYKKIHYGMAFIVSWSKKQTWNALYTSTIHVIFVIKLFFFVLKSMGIISCLNIFIQVLFLDSIYSRRARYLIWNEWKLYDFSCHTIYKHSGLDTTIL
jgi:hypothetical protein